MIKHQWRQDPWGIDPSAQVMTIESDNGQLYEVRNLSVGYSMFVRTAYGKNYTAGRYIGAANWNDWDTVDKLIAAHETR